MHVLLFLDTHQTFSRMGHIQELPPDIYIQAPEGATENVACWPFFVETHGCGDLQLPQAGLDWRALPCEFPTDTSTRAFTRGLRSCECFVRSAIPLSRRWLSETAPKRNPERSRPPLDHLVA